MDKPLSKNRNAINKIIEILAENPDIEKHFNRFQNGVRNIDDLYQIREVIK